MTDWPRFLARPRPFAADRWFARIADRVLNASALLAGDARLRVVEVEVYYHGPGHEDPFAHRDAVQLTTGRWYFHRTGGGLRGGSFKGLDLAFGGLTPGGPAYGGVLLRGAVGGGVRIDGPSLLVDFLLARTGCARVADLDAACGPLPAWDAANPVRLIDAPREDRPVLRTARVGLSSKWPEFVGRPYRFLTDPRGTKKGKAQMVRALLAAGESADRVRGRTGATAAFVARLAAQSHGPPVTSPPTAKPSAR